MRTLVRLLRLTGFAILLAMVGTAALDTRVIALDFQPSDASERLVDVTVVGGAGAESTLDFSGLFPGATVTAPVDLVKASRGSPFTVALTMTPTSSSLLTEDPVNGLQLAVDRCSVPWEPVAESPRTDYRCPTRTVSVLALRPVRMDNVPLQNLEVDDHTTQHLLLSSTLPKGAGNEFQGLSATMDYSFARLDPAGASTR
jgi:hypothetical protein